MKHTANTASDHGADAPLATSARSAAKGMAWTSLALMFSKSLSFLSQILLGYVLAVETYAVFGVAATALALAAGFQNPGISKALIQKTARFADFMPAYSAFAFQFGLIGAFVLVPIGAVFQTAYQIDGLFWVVALSSLSVPLISLNAVQMASLSVRYRFRDINITEMKRAVLYYVVLVGAALAGAEYFTIAVATLVGVSVQFVILRSLTLDTPVRFRISPRELAQTFWALRLVVLTGFLVALSMRADFLALGRLISIEALGYYTFGVMLVTSVTIPISAGINQVFLPVFSRLQADQYLLRKEVVRFSATIAILGAIICIVLVGVSAPVMHLLWGGKWDPAQIVVLLIAAAMPFRFLSTVAAAGLESFGKWGTRIVLLILEVTILLLGAGIGAALFGLQGAVVAAALQRAVSGVIGFSVLAGAARISPLRIAAFFLRTYAPFGLAVGILFGLDPARHGNAEGLATLALSGLETILALAVYLILTAALNRPYLASLYNLARSSLKRGAR